MIYFGSDLHIEFKQNYNYVYNKLKDKTFNNENDILLLLGDTFVIQNYSIQNNIFDLLSEKFKDVYVLFGNHEFYNGFNIALAEKNYFRSIRKNVYLINNYSFHYDNHKIILSTLFSHIKPENEFNAIQVLKDFKQIYYNEKLLTVEIYNKLHKNNLDFIKNEIEDGCIIGTHHVPTSYVINPKYKNSKIRDNFIIELFDMIYDSNIKYWLYGHNHYTVEKEINNTIVSSNQMGYYYSIDENFEFFKHLKI